MKTRSKITAAAALTLSAAVAAMLFAAGPFLCRYVLCPQWHGQDTGYTLDRMSTMYEGLGDWYRGLLDCGAVRDTVISGEGGNDIHAVYFAAPDSAPAAGTALLIHGYTCNHRNMLHLARMYREELGYNVFMPDLQHHGLSGGDAIQMGWLDRLDVLRWIDVAGDVFGDDFMVINGISMGGATTMMLSGEPLPPYVRALVEDCGYTDVWSELEYRLKVEFHLPAWPLLHLADRYCRRHYGWGFREASSLDQLSKSTVPVLFIHGDGDDYVPTAHVHDCYAAKTSGYKELWLAPGTAHSDSYRNHPDEYRDRVAAFIGKIKSNN